MRTSTAWFWLFWMYGWAVAYTMANLAFPWTLLLFYVWMCCLAFGKLAKKEWEKVERVEGHC